MRRHDIGQVAEMRSGVSAAPTSKLFEAECTQFATAGLWRAQQLAKASPHDVLTYLVDVGLASPSDLLNDEVRVTVTQSRNRCWLVSFGRGEDLFCKQALVAREAETVEHEALVLETLTSHSLAVAPKLRRFDPELSLLVTDGMASARTLAEHFGRTRRLSRRLSCQARDLLRRLHRLDIEQFNDATSRRFQVGPPWPLRVHHSTIDTVASYSACSMEILGIIQDQPEVCDALEGARAEWVPTSLLHGDLKWENILVVPHGRGRPTGGMTIVDWEFACLGPPEWDVAGLVAEYFRWWAASVTHPRAIMASGGNLNCGFPIAAMQPSAQALLAQSTGGLAIDRYLVMRFAGGRLLQRAIEEGQHQSRLTEHLVILTQLACNVLTDPSGALELLGISRSDVEA